MNQYAKKFLPLVVVAVVFAVGGYFIGQAGPITDQGASLFNTAPVKAGLIVTVNFDGSCNSYRDTGRRNGSGRIRIIEAVVTNGVLNSQGGCDPAALANNSNGNNHPVSTSRGTDNGDGTCTVTLLDGRKVKGIAMYTSTGFMGHTQTYVGCDISNQPAAASGSMPLKN